MCPYIFKATPNNILVSHHRAHHQNSPLEVFFFLLQILMKNMTKLDKHMHIWYQIKAYNAANVMGWRRHVHL